VTGRATPAPIEEPLTAVVARREPWGVWGGQLFERGVVVQLREPGQDRHRQRRSASPLLTKALYDAAIVPVGCAVLATASRVFSPSPVL
jgi:hypothetical protein